MRIGIIIGRIGGIDGVALETTKWIDVLKKIGHKVFVISGEFENWKMQRPDHFLCPLLSFFSAEAEWEQRKAFFEPDKSADNLMDHIEKVSNLIFVELEKWVAFNKIDCLLSENASALPCHISMGVAIKKLVEKTSIPIVTHDHDFHWERGDRYQSIHPEITQLVSDNFPLLIPHVKHAVINSFGVETFKNRFNISATMVPNVMDFNTSFGQPTKKNELFLRRIGVSKNEIPLLQVTRIVRRKGIETAISLVEKLNDKNIKLVISGNHNDDENNTYYNELVDQIHDLNLMNQVIFAAEKGINHVDLSDFYAHGRACTYFSTYEGFGNAFIEAVLAKKPIFVNDYKPVYSQDIGCHGFETLLIEDNLLTDKAVKKMAEIIYNPMLARQIGEFNYELGKKHFSFKILEQKLNLLFS
ncbi:MAG: glycosyltransferase family 4 protein [Crocinitomicaceae bacterium]|nr:glycosyltransferase family 4 protein [Crocinitomicaceae bacterium]